jgi:DNA-binding LytR/AlgR family response regulator
MRGQAFEVQTVDYLLKPIDDERFAGARTCWYVEQRFSLARFKHPIRALIERHTGSFRRYRIRMLAKTRRRISIVPVSEID